MGNFCTCLVPKTPPVKGKQSQRPAKRLTNPGGPATVANTSNRWSRIRSGSRKEKENFDDALIQEQALAAAILFRQHQQQQNGLGLPFDRSASLRYPNGSSSKKTQLPRSSSSRARSLTDPLLQPHQLLNLNRVCLSFLPFWLIDFHKCVIDFWPCVLLHMHMYLIRLTMA